MRDRFRYMANSSWVVVLHFALLLSPFFASADAQSDALIARLSAEMKKMTNYEVTFTARVDNGAVTVPGRYVVSGRSYYIEVDDRKIYSDGEVKYEVNDSEQEVTIDIVNTNDQELLSNPTRAFEFVDGSYTHKSAPEVTIAGKRCEVVHLTPSTQGAAIDEITLMLDSKTGLPVRVRYHIEGVASAVEITVNKISPLATVDKSLFSFSRNRHKGYEIIDFR